MSNGKRKYSGDNDSAHATKKRKISCRFCASQITMAEIDSHELAHKMDTKPDQEYIKCAHKSCNLLIPITEMPSHTLAHQFDAELAEQENEELNKAVSQSQAYPSQRRERDILHNNDSDEDMDMYNNNNNNNSHNINNNNNNEQSDEEAIFFEMKELKKWLKSDEMFAVLKVFQQIEDVCESTEDEWTTLGLNNVGHRARLRRLIREWKETKEIEQKKQSNNNINPLRSVRSTYLSFGELWSHKFQSEVVNAYKESVARAPKGLFMPRQPSLSDNDQKLDGLIASDKQQNILRYYHDNYYGQNEVFQTAFGTRPVIYCDWTASGKPLECVERYLCQEMYTLYANTHTTTSITGIQTSKFRSEARSIILESLHGDIDKDCVIFCGSGVTGTIYKMSRILMQSIGKSYKPETTVVFISIYEHNSNIFIWKELGCKVIVIPETNKFEKGGIDLQYLETKLQMYTASCMKNKYTLIIGSFTAASNVSGIIAPIEETTLLLHKYGALSFWDYATAGPYLDINMTNKDNPMLSKDAVFISTHKYLAGPGSPGILCAKKKLFENYMPVVPGGGTVFAAFGVDDGDWEYLENIEEREEGGTPDIIGSVRAAFAFIIKDHLSTELIEQTEMKYLNYFLNETKSINNLVIIGNTKCKRLPVLSFLITHSQNKMIGRKITKYLHYNFIAALFNDLFGIQGRGGCACAGMYGLFALGLKDEEVVHVLKQMREHKNELARPGYFRINLHYTLTENELKYIVNAVKYVCDNGWKFLPLYDVNKETGNYFHRDIKRKPNLLKKQLRSLLDISFNENDGKMEWIQKHMRVDNVLDNLDKFFILADNVLDNLKEYLPSKEEFVSENDINDESAWYWLPSELYQD